MRRSWLTAWAQFGLTRLDIAISTQEAQLANMADSLGPRKTRQVCGGLTRPVAG